MWQARNKVDLIIEVWEKLDCESIGRKEIEAIETAVEEVYGNAAVDSPMVIARLLADEGAELRHSELMSLYVERASFRPYDASFRQLIDLSSLPKVRRSIQGVENLRRRYQADGDKEGLRRIRNLTVQAREEARASAAYLGPDDPGRHAYNEIDSWLRVWLETPEVFESWLELRIKTPEFLGNFGELGF